MTLESGGGERLNGLVEELIGEWLFLIRRVPNSGSILSISNIFIYYSFDIERPVICDAIQLLPESSQ